MSDLILVPTSGERSRLEGELSLDARRWSIETIGFGVIASSVGTANAIAKHAPSRVVLAGIAGMFESRAGERLRLGNASWFDTIWIDGIGVGRGDAFQTAERLGWNWFGHFSEKCDELGERPARLHLDAILPRGESPAGLLTVCSASDGSDDATYRSRCFSEVVGEDMESFAVAYACKAAGIPLSVVRGFSNFVGERDHSQWQVEEALKSVVAKLQPVIDGEMW